MDNYQGGPSKSQQLHDLQERVKALEQLIGGGGGSNSSAYLTMLIPRDGFEDLDSEETAELLQISEDDLHKLQRGEYPSIIEKGTYNSYLVTADEDGRVYFFSGDQEGFGASFALYVSDGVWSGSEI